VNSAVEASKIYREPFGCGYTSTRLWRTVLMNKLWGPRQLVCIAKLTNELAYSATFAHRSAKDGERGMRCAFDLPYKAEVFARSPPRRDCLTVKWTEKRPEYPNPENPLFLPSDDSCDKLSGEELSLVEVEASRLVSPMPTWAKP
jgi:hypothetical protein